MKDGGENAYGGGGVVAQEVDEPVVVEFEHGEREPDVEAGRVIGGQLEDAPEGPRRQSRRPFVADDGVRLAAARLPVGANAHVETVKGRLDQSLHYANVAIFVFI